MKAYIKAISYYLPDKVYSNEDLAHEYPDWSSQKVFTKIGVNRRHIASDSETASDLAVKAAEALFQEFSIDRDQIDYILFCTQSPDYFLPTTACLLQTRLGLSTSCGALDYNLGCSGFVYGLSLAKGLILSESAKNVLLITAETYSKYIHPQDKGNKSIFGDGAAACIISTEGCAEIGSFVFGTDGKGAENLIVKNGASRNFNRTESSVIDDAGSVKSDSHLYMNGSEIFNFTLESVPLVVDSTLAKNNLTVSDVDYYVLHQANKFMLDTIRKVCLIPEDCFYNDLSETGNTVSSTIPIALKEAMGKEFIGKDKRVLIAGFGVGYSWAGTILRY